MALGVQAQKSVFDMQHLKLDSHAVDSQVEFSFLENHYNGMGWLRNDVSQNLANYPMAEADVLSSRDKEHEAHKRWERYMRKLPVYVHQVNDINKFLEVKVELPDQIKLCESFKDTVWISISNTSSIMLNSELELSQNPIIQWPKDNRSMALEAWGLSPMEALNYGGNGRFTFSILPNSTIRIRVAVVYSCDGYGGDRILQSLTTNEIQMDYQLILSGYIYNREEQELYRCISGQLPLKSIKLTQTTTTTN